MVWNGCLLMLTRSLHNDGLTSAPTTHEHATAQPPGRMTAQRLPVSTMHYNSRCRIFHCMRKQHRRTVPPRPPELCFRRPVSDASGQAVLGGVVFMLRANRSHRTRDVVRSRGAKLVHVEARRWLMRAVPWIRDRGGGVSERV